jgi:hypothetical protein
MDIGCLDLLMKVMFMYSFPYLLVQDAILMERFFRLRMNVEMIVKIVPKAPKMDSARVMLSLVNNSLIVSFI